MTASNLQRRQDGADEHISVRAGGGTVVVSGDAALPAEWEESERGSAPEGSAASSLDRYRSALGRFKWLIMGFGVLGAAVGVVAIRFLKPLYATQATVILTPNSREDRSLVDNFQRSGYLELLTAFNVVDPVVTKLRLYLAPKSPTDSVLFRDFSIEPNVVPGKYVLRAALSGYELEVNGLRVVETGQLGDSIGRSLGFRWLPDSALLRARGEVQFTVITPREVSVALQKEMEPRLIEGSNLLRMTLSGTDPRMAATTLNTWADRFVEVATEFKRFQVSRRATMLDGQLEYAANELAAAERALEDFRVRTATLPSESRIPQLAGAQLTQDPVFSAYANQQATSESLRRDKAAIVRGLTAGPNGSVSPEALYSVPSVATDPAAIQLRTQLDELLKRDGRLRELRQRYTEEYRDVVLEREAVEALRSRDIPASVNALVATLDERLGALSTQISASELDLKGIPQRAIELGRLTRQMQVQDERYRSLLASAQNAKLAEQTTPPDIAVFDRAIPPLRPTRNQAPVIVAGAILAALALGVGLALLLDLVDKRFRYPSQATDELGLFVLGVIPEFGRARGKTDEQVQLIEAFRSVRMNLRYAIDPSQPLAFTVTSAGPGDGKSLVSANLALSFADGGSRVLLIDGDVRRGRQHETFQGTQSPGVVEYLEGTALLPEAIRPTAYGRLHFMPSGRRIRKAPELLTGPRFTQLVALLKSEYDVIIVDSPPLGAGADAYSLSIATGHMVMVLRAGVSDRKLAAAKLRLVQSLPIQILGGVLNGIKLSGMYEYYSYYGDYAATDDPSAALPEGTSKASNALVASK